MWRAFSTHFSAVTNILFNDVHLTAPVDPKVSPPEPKKYLAIWDTGATNSVITSRVANDLGLQPITKIQTHGVHGAQTVNGYLVHIHLPNKTRFLFVQVTEAQSLSGNFDVLIGMDIITKGDFAVTHHGGKTCMSFRMPPSHEIDFVKELQENPPPPAGANRQQRRDWERKHKRH